MVSVVHSRESNIGRLFTFPTERVHSHEGLPKNPKDMVFYQIYSSTFQDSNKDGIGDIGGIISRLGYVQRLGVNMLWISPMYPSPQKDGGYDVSDYKGIDPRFGTLKDFDKLVSESRKRGIGIVMDFVGSHTSDQHEWFKRATDPLDPECQRYQQYYHFMDPKPDGSPPNNWVSILGGPAWRYIPEVGKYVFHKFDSSQPDLNLGNREVIEEEKRILNFWLDRGVAGFRFDSMEHMLEDSTFGDMAPNPFYQEGQRKIYQWKWVEKYTGYSQLYAIVSEFTDVIHRRNGVVIAENLNATRDQLKELIRRGVDLPFNFALLNSPFTPESLKSNIDTYMEIFTKLPETAIANFVLGSHDVSRLASRIGQKQMPIAQLLLLTLPGTPFIYNGDEIGMINATIPPNRHRDPQAYRDNIKHSRDVARTPILWSPWRRNAGFSKADPVDLWLPLSEIPRGSTVAYQEKSWHPHSLFNLTKHLIHLRNTTSTLRYGDCISFAITNPGVFSFGREYQGNIMATVMNMASTPQEYTLPAQLNDAKVIFTTSGKKTRVKNRKILLSPYEGLILTSFQ